MKHGTYGAWQSPCRCDECRAFIRDLKTAKLDGKRANKAAEAARDRARLRGEQEDS